MGTNDNGARNGSAREEHRALVGAINARLADLGAVEPDEEHPVEPEGDEEQQPPHPLLSLDGLTVTADADAAHAARAAAHAAEHGAVLDARELAARLDAAPDARARNAVALDREVLRAAALMQSTGEAFEFAELRRVVKAHRVSLATWDDGVRLAAERLRADEERAVEELRRASAARTREAEERAREAREAAERGALEARRRAAGEDLAGYIGSFELNGATFEARPGITMMEKQGKRGTEETELANFSPRIIESVAEFASPNAAPVNTLRVGLAFAGGAPVTGEITAADLISGEFFERISHRAEVYGGRDVRRHLCIAMQRLSAGSPVRTRRAFTGYVRDASRPEGWIYQHAAGAIAAEGAIEGAEVCLPDGLNGFALPDPPEGEALRAAALAVLELCEVQPSRVILPVVALAVRAVLGPTAKGMVVWLYGPTGTGKSLVASIVQRFNGAGLLKETVSFLSVEGGASDSSYGGALRRLAAVGDAAVFLDEAKNERGVALASAVAHAVFNRSVSSKLRRDGSDRNAARPRSHAVITAELAPRGESASNRMCALHMTERCADLTRFDALATEGAFARATAALISWHLGSLARDGDGDLDAVLLRDRGMASAWDLGAGDRAAEVLGPLAVGADTLATWLSEVLPDHSERAEAVRDRARGVLAELATERVSFNAEEDPARRCIELAADALRAGAVHVVKIASNGLHGAPANPDAWGWRPGRDGTLERRGECLGYLVEEHPEHAAINRGALLKAAKARARELDHPLPLDARSIGPALDRAGLLKTGEEKDGTRYTPRVRLGKGARVRLLLIRREALTGDEPSTGDGRGDA